MESVNDGMMVMDAQRWAVQSDLGPSSRSMMGKSLEQRCQVGPSYAGSARI